MVCRIGVLASGRGSNLQALIDALKNGEDSYQIEVVISDKEEAQALIRAKKEQIPNIFINPREFSHKEEFEQAILEVIRKHNCNLICLAGFMRILTPSFINKAGVKIVNIHPSLLPAFPGLNAHQQALDYGIKYSGCTVHFVDEGVDSGPIILQAVVPVEVDDTVETLSQRILKEEHKLYPLAIKLIAEGKVKVEGRKVRISGQVSKWASGRVN